MKHAIQIAIVAFALLGVACGGEEAEPAAVETPTVEPEVAPQPDPVPEPEPAPVAVTETTLPPWSMRTLMSALAPSRAASSFRWSITSGMRTPLSPWPSTMAISR